MQLLPYNQIFWPRAGEWKRRKKKKKSVSKSISTACHEMMGALVRVCARDNSADAEACE